MFITLNICLSNHTILLDNSYQSTRQIKARRRNGNAQCGAIKGQFTLRDNFLEITKRNITTYGAEEDNLSCLDRAQLQGGGC